MNKSNFRKLGASVTALKLLVLAVDTLKGVIINGGIIDGKVKIEGSKFTPSEDLALYTYIIPPVVYALGGIIYMFFTCLTTCCKDDECWKGFWDTVLCFFLTAGGLLYYFGDNLLNLASGRDLGRTMDELETIMQILLIIALILYRVIPLILTKAELASYEGSKGDDEDTKGFDFIQAALDLVALALDFDAIFSVIEKTQCSCTMESGTCSRGSEIICPTGDVYRLIWALYGLLLVGYIIVSICALSFKWCKTEDSNIYDIIGAITLAFLGLISLAFLLVADNQLPLKCESGGNSQNRLGLLAASSVIYLFAFGAQVALHIYYYCSD